MYIFYCHAKLSIFACQNELLMVEKEINILDYDYPLPDERIAKYPLDERSESKLLIYRQGKIREKQFKDLPETLPKGAALIFNNTKVIQARIPFRKATGAAIEVFCLEPHAPRDYAEAFQTNGQVVWQCMVGNAKKWKEGSLFKEISLVTGETCQLQATCMGREGNAFVIAFKWDKSHITFAELLDQSGLLPIPPYLNRQTETIDHERYQTVYSKIKGSVAAPTAGLHFTPEVIKALANKNIITKEVTLHVGAGTFKPVKEADARNHEMHTETITLSKDFLQYMAKHNGAIVSVGTTSMRTLESLYWLAHKTLNLDTYNDLPLELRQWEAYKIPPTLSKQEAFEKLVAYLEKTGQEQLYARTQIMITPGYTFRMVDGLVTNFHQPKSTLLLLVSAFIGEDWKKVYEYAMDNNFRFLSYGDSSFLWPKNKARVEK